MRLPKWPQSHPPIQLPQPLPFPAPAGPRAHHPWTHTANNHKNAARTNRISYRPSQDRRPSPITTYITEVDRNSSDFKVAQPYKRHRIGGGGDGGRDHLEL